MAKKQYDIVSMTLGTDSFGPGVNSQTCFINYVFLDVLINFSLCFIPVCKTRII